LRDDSDVFQALTQAAAQQREETGGKRERGSPRKVGGRSGEGWRELRWVQVGFEGRTKGLIRIKVAHGRRK